MARKLFALAALLAAGCSVTGRVQVNPATPMNQYTTDAGIKGVGPIRAELEFRHEF